MKSFSNIAMVVGLICLPSALSAENSNIKYRVRNTLETSGMRICDQNESPVVIIDGHRVQHCRLETIDDLNNTAKLFREILGPPPSQQLVENSKLCQSFIDRSLKNEAIPYCQKASSLGDGVSSYALASIFMSDQSNLNRKSTALPYFKLSSDQKLLEGSLQAGIILSMQGNFLEGKKYLLRCYQPSINGNLVHKNPYSPNSETQHICTDVLIKMALMGKINLKSIVDEAVVIPSAIDREIEISEYKKWLNGTRQYTGSWDSYKGTKLDTAAYSGKISYSIWMSFENPVLCIIRDDKGELIKGDLDHQICRYFQANYVYKPAIGSSGDPIPSVLSGSIQLSLPRSVK